MKTIEETYNQNYTFVDVRSPKEFEEDHIPGAINIPLFSNEERAIVGTIYKQESKDLAIDKGLEFLSTKLPEMVQKYKEIKGPICIYCARGGMRSGSITSLLKSIGFNVIKLKEGYKDYRRFVREQLEQITIPKLVVIYGYTGSGKTELLNKLPNSLDLEGLAGHRGSIFGDINLKPHSQKKFDSLLLKRLIELKDEKVVFTEGESRRIGRILIHEKVWKQMQKSVNCELVVPIQERIDRIEGEYFKGVDPLLIKEKLHLIQKYLGKKKVEEISNYLDQGNKKEAIRICLVDYYDKLYDHTISNRDISYKIQSVEELLEIDFIKPTQ